MAIYVYQRDEGPEMSMGETDEILTGDRRVQTCTVVMSRTSKNKTKW